jgi:ribonuclease-3
MKDSNNLFNKIGYSFNNYELFLEAVTHSSYSYEQKISRNYERLEFLGDAVLQLIITEYLMIKYSNFDEGTLSKYRGYIVSEDFFSKIAKKINLGDYIRLGKGELQSKGYEKPSLLCDIFESFIAAIYLDGGYETAKKIVLNLTSNDIDNIIENELFIDYKTELQKITQKDFNELPEYKIIKEEGPEHLKTFYIKVTIGNKDYAIGIGTSKKKAEQDAAKKTLNLLSNEK